jgi:L-ascorbate metabolism protein UlaG (beta-lactamase superfamily)
MDRKSETRITWLGHASFRMESPAGKTLLMDPWLRNNPACPQEFKSIRKADIMLLTHGHSDHFEDAVELARSPEMKVVANFEICTYLRANGATKALPMNKGGSQVVEGIRVTMVPAERRWDSSWSSRTDSSYITLGTRRCSAT